MTNYKLLNEQLKQLTQGVANRLSNLANASSLLFHTLDDLNWAGFYLADENKLTLGPFQGKVACIEIPFGKGVCGTAVAQNRTLVIDNVHDFNGHIACDSRSLSEIVVPIHKDEKIVGVLDVDSPTEKRFTQTDKLGLEQFVRIIESIW